jgi:hypothetical protein
MYRFVHYASIRTVFAFARPSTGRGANMPHPLTSKPARSGGK